MVRKGIAAWAKPETWDQVQFGLRLGINPQAIVWMTPKPSPLIRALTKRAGTIITRGSTFDNLANLAPSALAAYASATKARCWAGRS